MTKTRTYMMFMLAILAAGATAQTANLHERAMWGAINGVKNASLDSYQQHTGKVLITWRMLPDDDAKTAFDLYRKVGSGMETRISSKPILATCFQHDALTNVSGDVHYRLTYAGDNTAIASYTMPREQMNGQ
jgi:hypothetical protein